MSEEASAAFRLLDIDDPAGGLLAYAIDRGDLEDQALDGIWKRFDDAAASGSKIRVYAEMAGVPSVNASMILDKLKRLGTIMSTVERMAIVGDAGWLDLYTKIVDPITKPDIKHFTTDQRDEALAWVRA
jgi:hypothetical protein